MAVSLSDYEEAAAAAGCGGSRGRHRRPGACTASRRAAKQHWRALPTSDKVWEAQLNDPKFILCSRPSTGASMLFCGGVALCFGALIEIPVVCVPYGKWPGEDTPNTGPRIGWGGGGSCCDPVLTSPATEGSRAHLSLCVRGNRQACPSSPVFQQGTAPLPWARIKIQQPYRTRRVASQKFF